MMRELVIVEEAKDRVNKENANIDKLPTELFNLILSNLFLDDWIRFRLTSKAWRSITPPIRPYSLVKQYKSESQSVPWLLSFLNNKGVCNLYHPLYSDTYTMNIPELAGTIVRDAKFGWLLMSRGETSIFFYNPLTMETIELPGHENYYNFVNISFSSPPTSSDCIVFGHHLCAKMSVYLKKCETWFDYWIETPLEFMASYCNPVFSDGVFYSLSRDGKLGVFDPSAEEGSEWKVLPVPPVVCFGGVTSNTSTRSFIMGYDGEIFSVALGYMGKTVSVFKLDCSRMEWHRLESLDDKVAFLSHTSSMLVPARLKGVENRIYLPKFQGKESLFYSMKTGKYHCFGSKDSQVDWTNTSEHWNCTWIDSIL
ncbi:F-box/kelch-repeat protein [Thalictrum thalictroides]|uniref:F-box/kelch-repeat protein n=1 Tax=Thalictrum thalictroides TaxID=46969 RepID=A0A7J6W9M5_THATH|nr:F-box/kelch-repeat protein [Thalictrum thalictroides]